MTEYDPLNAPDPEGWLATDDDERLLLVLDFHRRARIRLPARARHLHAELHVVVENQLAMRDAVVVRTADRLLREGLDRHEMIHAIGSVLIEMIWDVAHGEETGPDLKPGYYAALDRLTAESWRTGSNTAG